MRISCDGLVTPTLLDALEVAGYDRGFEIIVEQAAEAQRVGSHGAVIADWRVIQRDERHRGCQRRARLTKTPPFGFSVADNCGVAMCPGATVTRYRCMSIAMMSCASIMAKSLPMH